MSNRNSLLGSSHKGFQQIPETKTSNGGPPSAGDATIEIPLATVQSKASGKGIKSPSSVLNEKSHAFVPGPGKRKQERRTGAEGDDGLRSMGRLYERLLNFSIFTRYLLYILPMGAVISIPIIIGATAAPGAKMGGIRIGMYSSRGWQRRADLHSLDICVGLDSLGSSVGIQTFRKDFAVHIRVPLRDRKLSD